MTYTDMICQRLELFLSDTKLKQHSAYPNHYWHFVSTWWLSRIRWKLTTHSHLKLFLAVVIKLIKIKCLCEYKRNPELKAHQTPSSNPLTALQTADFAWQLY